MIVGNDISSFQGDVNYDIYKTHTNFLLIKATEGNGLIDPKFLRNQQEVRRVNLPHGYYHFARPDLNNSPEQEADFFLKVIGQLEEGEVLCLDYEATWTGDPVVWCKGFLDAVFNKTSVRPLLYLNQSLIVAHDWKPVALADYGLWVAAYTHDPNNNNFVTGAWAFASMQQWTDNQNVPGIAGAVDGNAFFGTIDVFLRYGYHEVAPLPTPCDQQVADLQKQITDLKAQAIQEKGIIQKVKDFLSSEIQF